jgi:hypothetical protein
MPRQLTLNKVEVVCTFADEVRYSSYIGNEVLLAYQVIASGPSIIYAKATLTKFASQEHNTVAVFTGPRILPEETKISEPFEAGVFKVLSDDHYSQPAFGKEELSANDAGAFFTRGGILSQIAAQVRLNAGGICGFSAVPVSLGEGLANPIRPLALGGREHVRNFIYLHDEPARLFNDFAWTVGPNLEIVADTYAVTSSVLSTANPSGKLMVSDDPTQWPDERALAWHREQFMQRLR